MKVHNREWELEFFQNSINYKGIALDVQMIYMISGELEVTAGDGVFMLGREDYIIINAGESYHIKTHEDSIWAVLKIDYQMIAGQMKIPCVYFLCNSTKHIFDDTRYDSLNKMLKNLLAEHLYSPQTDSFKKKRLFYTLLERLTSDFIIFTPSALDRMSVDGRMNYVLQYICANYNQPLHQNDIARMVYLSPSTFSRWFKRRSGMNYKEFIREVRMNHAARELISTTKSITEIAVEQGFTDASCFIKLFRQRCRMSPAAFRKVALSQSSEGEENKTLMSKIRKAGIFSRDDFKLSHSKDLFLNVKTDLAWHNPWGIMLNAGEAHLLLFARMQEQIRYLKKSLGIKYIRVRNFFSRNMRLRGGAEGDRINYDYLDSVMDFIQSCGLIPVIDLSDRPSGDLKSLDKMLYEEMWESAFHSTDEMYETVSKAFSHFARRYGIGKVGTWLVECWVDDCRDQIMGMDAQCETVFLEIYRRLKSIVPGIRVGGFGLDLAVSGKYFAELLKKVVKNGCRPDFASIYIYPYDCGQSRLQDTDYTKKSIFMCQNILKEAGLENTPVIVSEWNLSLSMRNFYNDSCAKAALMLQHMAGTMDIPCVVAYSMASDLSINYFESSAVLYGAGGLCSKDGLLKPVYYASLFLSDFEGKLIGTGENYIAAVRNSGELDILLFYAKMPDYRYFMKKEYEISAGELSEYFDHEDELELRVELKELPDGVYMKKYHILNSENGSLMENWQAMGDVGNTTVKIMEYLKNITQPRIYFEKTAVRNGLLFLTEKLSPNEIRYLQIYTADSWSGV